MTTLFAKLQAAGIRTQNGIIKNLLTLTKAIGKQTTIPKAADNFMDDLEWNFMYIDKQPFKYSV